MNNIQKPVTHSKLTTSMQYMVSDLELNSEVQKERERESKERAAESLRKSRWYRQLKYFSVNNYIHIQF